MKVEGEEYVAEHPPLVFPSLGLVPIHTEWRFVNAGYVSPE